MADAASYDNTRRGLQADKDPVQFMGSDPVTLAASADLTLTFEPDYDLNPQYIRIPDAFAPNVAIVGMKAGPVSLMAGGGVFPGDAFKGSGTLRIATALPITQKAPLKITVRNLTTSAITGFFMGVSGRVKRAE